MLKVRKGFVQLLSLVLFLSLPGIAMTISFNHTLGQPKKVESLLSQSKLYNHFVAYATDQAKQTAGGSDTSGSVSLNDAAVQSAAQAAFPPSLIQQNINTVIDSNYDWLEGKTATPEFKINLTAEKNDFAERVGQYVKTYTAGLPVCANTVLAFQQNSDPLAATCRPSELSPDTAGAQITQQLRSTGDFLSNPVITASNFNPKADTQKEPYYQKLAKLPKVYRAAKRAPAELSILALVCALGIIAMAPVRRKGVRRIGFVALFAGIVLAILQFCGGRIFNHAQQRAFNPASTGPLQQSLTDFTHRIQSATARTELWFAIAFIILGLAIILAAAKAKPRTSKITEVKKDKEPAERTLPTITRTPRGQQSNVNAPTPEVKRRKPPRLIQ